MSGVWGKFKRIFRREKSPEPEKEEKPVDFDKYYEPEIIGQSNILTHDEIIFIDKSLPERLVGVKWELKYSTENDGYSLRTLYRKLNGWENSVLLVIKDECGHRFGAYGTEAFKPDYKVRGNYECFVFRMKHEKFYKKYNLNPPAPKLDKRKESKDSCISGASAASGSEADKESDKVSKVEMVKCEGKNNANILKGNGASRNSKADPVDPEFGLKYDFSQNRIWRWSCLVNSVFIHCERDWLWFGLNNGDMAVFVDQDLRLGGSNCCKVFDNERLAPNPKLAPSESTFKVLHLEVWGFRQ